VIASSPNVAANACARPSNALNAGGNKETLEGLGSLVTASSDLRQGPVPGHTLGLERGACRNVVGEFQQGQKE
jgi:hypothetical protein